MAQYRVHRVFTQIVEADSKEEAEDLFNVMDAEADFILDVILLDEKGNEIDD